MAADHNTPQGAGAAGQQPLSKSGSGSTWSDSLRTMAKRLGFEASDQRAWIALVLILIAAVLPYFLGQRILDEVVPLTRIDGVFFGTYVPLPSAVSAHVANRLYTWGLTVVITILLAILVIGSSVYTILVSMGRRRVAAIFIGIGVFLCLLLLIWVEIGGGPTTGIIADITESTVGMLPDEPAGIGDVGSSIEDVHADTYIIVVWATAFAAIGAAATLSDGGKSMAVRVQAGGSAAAPPPHDQGVRLRNLIFISALTLTATIVVAHFYLEIGAAMLEDAAAPGIRQHLARYELLRQTGEMYWGVISSATLAIIYFPAAVVIWYEDPNPDKAGSRFPISSAVARILPILLPALTGPLLEFVQGLLGTSA